MKDQKDYPSNVFSISKMVKVPVYSTLRYENGKLIGEIEGYIETPIEWIEERKEH